MAPIDPAAAAVPAPEARRSVLHPLRRGQRAGWACQVARIVLRLPDAIARRLDAMVSRRRQRRALADLDPHLLADIGLTAADVARECRKPFWR